MIGILAGMGPRSTTPFLETVLDECVRQFGAALDADFPAMMVHSLPTPFVLDSPLDHDGMRRSTRAGLERLVAADAHLIAIPCNVAHVYFDDVVDGIDVPVLSLIEATAATVPDDVGAVTVLATRQTLEADLYGPALRSRGLNVRDGSAYQAPVDELIGGVKAGRGADLLDREWEGLVRQLEADGVSCVVLGSTDLSAVPAAVRESRLRVVDSGAALAAALVARWRAEADEVANAGTAGVASTEKGDRP